MASRGMTVTYLRREEEAGMTLADLPLGSTRELTEAETAALAETVGGSAQVRPGPDPVSSPQIVIMTVQNSAARGHEPNILG